MLGSFLRLGYFLDFQPEWTFDLRGIDPGRYAATDERELLDLGVEKLRSAVARRFEPGRRHLVPISGGLDSRAVLACLLEHTEARNLETYTFGTPGTLDHDIGNEVARAVGTNHTVFPLTEHTYRLEELLDVSRRIRHQTVLFHHPPLWRLDELYSEHVVWTGFLGDWLSGVKVPASPAREPGRAREAFLRANTYVRSVDLTAGDGQQLAAHLDPLPLAPEVLSYEEQLNLGHRQVKFIAPHVLPSGFTYRAPLTDQEIFDFLLSVPADLRRHGRFYRRLLAHAFPDLFSIRTKANQGLPLDAGSLRVASRKLVRRLRRKCRSFLPAFVDPNTNYLPFRDALVERPDLRALIRESLSDLQRRHIVDWIDVDGLWKEHVDGKRAHTGALLVLTSLEIHLKAGLALDRLRACS